MGGHCDRVSDRKRRMNGFKHDRETGCDSAAVERMNMLLLFMYQLMQKSPSD